LRTTASKTACRSCYHRCVLRKKYSTQENGQSRTPRVQARRFRSALAGQLSATIAFPRNLVLASDVNHESNRSFNAPAAAFDGNTGIKIELVERCALHFWRLVEGNSNLSTRTLSPLGRLLDDRNTTDRASRIRQKMNARASRERGVLDAVKVIKSWVLPKLDRASGKSLINDLFERFDRQQVPEQQLYRYDSAGERRRVVLPAEARRQSPLGDDPCDWIKLDIAHGQMNRAVLLLHGTCSSVTSMVNSFAELAPADRFYDENETASTWAINREVDWTKDVEAVAKKDVLLFNTLGNSPANLTPQLKSGVHHLNYFCNRSVREFIRKKLDNSNIG